MNSSKRYRTMSLIWLTATIMLLIMALLDPTMFIFAALAGFLAYTNRKNAKRRAAEEILESEAIPTNRGPKNVRKGPRGLKTWHTTVGRK